MAIIVGIGVWRRRVYLSNVGTTVYTSGGMVTAPTVMTQQAYPAAYPAMGYTTATTTAYPAVY